ncbi:hypothetical protein [Segatella oulorum]|nr:hypothetical protein [Segatella oulorum]
MMPFNGMVQKGMVEFGRGGACVPARVALQGRIHHSFSAHNACIFGMETPLRGRSGGHTGTAPTVPFGWIACKWLFGLCGIAWTNMMEFGRGGACVPARVALQGRIHRSSPAHNVCIFGMETPLRGRSGGHTGTAPTIPNTYRRSAKVKTRVLMLA